MENWQTGVINDRAADYFVRLCLAGVNRMTDINNALIAAGFAHSGGQHAFWMLWDRLSREGRVVRPMRGRYFAACPHCGEPILNVMGTEH